MDGSVPAAKHHDQFLQWLCEQADIVYLNDFEGRRVTGVTSIEGIIAGLQSLGPQVAFLKVGASGSYIVTQKSSEKLPAFEIDVVDTVAAGDAYIATTLLLLLRGMEYREAGLWGSAAGALACLGAGSLSSRFTLDEVERLVQRGPTADSRHA